MLALGCMRLSTDATRDDARSAAVLAAALDAGVQLLDTADAYALDDADLGHNEQLIAAALAGRTGIEVVTKGGLVRPEGIWHPNGRAKHLDAAARASRDRLGVTAIDMYLLHAIDPSTPLATSVRALAKLRDAGVARKIGVSNVNRHKLEQALAVTTIDAIQIELSPWHTDALRDGLVTFCAERGIRVLAHRPLGGPPGVKRLARDSHLATTAGAMNATPAEVALAWLRAHGVIPLPGATRVETARSAARALVLDAVAIADLDAHLLDPLGPAKSGKATGGMSNAATNETSPAGTHASSRAAPQSTRTGEVVPIVGMPGGGRASSGAAPQSTAKRTGEVVLIVGMPGAGKSTLAGRYVADGFARLNRDERGGTLRDIAKALDMQLVRAIETSTTPRIVLDNTYPTRASRATVLAVAKRRGVGVRCVVADTSLEDAQHNAALRVIERYGRLLEPDELAREKQVGPGAQFRYRRQFEPPRDDEGFTSIEHVTFERATSGSNATNATNATSATANANNATNETASATNESSATANATRATSATNETASATSAMSAAANAMSASTLSPGSAAIALGTSGRRALIVELDNVVWRGRPRAPEQIELLDGAIEQLARWRAAGYVLAATTWQPEPIADGLDVALVAKLGVPIAIARCSHPPGPPVCWCRKPMPGLALLLAHQQGFELTRSAHLGRGPADRGFATRAGLAYFDLAAGWPAPS